MAQSGCCFLIFLIVCGRCWSKYFSNPIVKKHLSCCMCTCMCVCLMSEYGNRRLGEWGRGGEVTKAQDIEPLKSSVLSYPELVLIFWFLFSYLPLSEGIVLLVHALSNIPEVIAMLAQCKTPLIKMLKISRTGPALWNCRVGPLHFRSEEAKTQRRKGTCPRSHSRIRIFLYSLPNNNNLTFIPNEITYIYLYVYVCIFLCVSYIYIIFPTRILFFILIIIPLSTPSQCLFYHYYLVESNLRIPNCKKMCPQSK